MKTNILKTAVALLVAGGAFVEARAQLAITEVMAAPTVTCDGVDYWELTNFGTNDINLHDYRFRDNGDFRPSNPFTNLVIQAGKSVLFVRSQPTSVIRNAEDVRNYWGADNLGPELQEIRFYDQPGFNDSVGDEVWLAHFVKDEWGNVIATNVVAMVKFEQSIPGRAFTYHPDTGIFGDFSVPGRNGAFRSARCTNDVGSPGVTTGEVRMSIIAEPEDQAVDAGIDVNFRVVAGGMPRPRYQWTHNGTNVPGATAFSLTISNVQPADEGLYQVLVSNGVMELASAAAMLVVNTNCLCAQILRTPSDISVFPALLDSQPAIFSVVARGYPPPRYQWSSNAIEISDATNRTLVIPSATLEMSGTVYGVQVWNEPSEQCPVGAFPGSCLATIASAVLTVTRRPRLKITEVMAAPAGELQLRHDVWFELTNCDTNAVNLQGYRFADGDLTTGVPSLLRVFTVTNRVVIHPDESIIFVRGISAEAFRQWWGPENLPSGLQILTFDGFSLSGSGEALALWNAAATYPLDSVASASWAENAPGISVLFRDIYCDESSGCSSQVIYDSVPGLAGGFRAVEDGDIGSPGYMTNPPPRLLSLTRTGADVTLKCRVIEGGYYRLGFKNDLSEPSWTPLTNTNVTNSLITMQDNTARNIPARFYRLEEVP